MNLLSVNVGLPREVHLKAPWNEGRVITGIFKDPVSGPVCVKRLDLVGDGQADLTVHGGPLKAVYAYPYEHYDYWRGELPKQEFTPGIFGENLTIAGLHENDVHIGDRFRIGTTELTVTQPRVPCYKLGIRFGREDMVKRFLASRRTGFYFSVAREGKLAAGDTVELVSREADNLTVGDIINLYAFERGNREMLRRAVELEALPDSWRGYFQERLQGMGH